MWKFKLAAAAGPGVAAHAIKEEKLLKFGRWIALGASVAYLLLGALAVVLGHYVVGPIVGILAFPIAIIEFPFRPIAKFVDIFQVDFRWRTGLYILYVIPTFFSIVTFVAGLILLAAAVLYAIAGFFKGAKGTSLKSEKQATGDQPKEEKKKGKDKDKDKKSSLASQGAAPGVV